MSGRDRLRLPPHTARHAGRDADTGPDYTDEPARAETPGGSRWGDGSLSSRRASARWRYGPDPVGCSWRASADLLGPHTSPPSSPAPNAGGCPSIAWMNMNKREARTLAIHS